MCRELLQRPVPLRRAARRLGILRGLGQPLEPERVDIDMSVGKESDSLAAQHQGSLVTEGSTGVIGRLVQPRGRFVEVEVGPERVDHLLAVQ